jgi:transcriptional regulator with XRE-family HTH domain
MEIGQRVKDMCAQKGCTLAELAARMGVSASSLSQILNGNPTLSKLNAIASALNVEVSELFTQPKQGVISCPHCGKPINIKVE